MGAHFEVEIVEDYVVKTPTALFLETWDVEEWASVVNNLSEISAIQPVSVENGKIIQPLAPGKALVELGMSVVDEKVSSQIDSALAEIGSRGYELENVHHGNVFYDPETDQITIIDLGQLSKKEKEG